jgi:hypothetical protein
MERARGQTQHPDHGRQLLAQWCTTPRRYGQRIASTRGKGRVSSDLKQVRSMLARALPNMFHYLDDRRQHYVAMEVAGLTPRVAPENQKTGPRLVPIGNRRRSESKVVPLD